MMELLYTDMRREDADVSICGMYSVYADRIQRVYPADEYCVMTGQRRRAWFWRESKCR